MTPLALFPDLDTAVAAPAAPTAKGRSRAAARPASTATPTNERLTLADLQREEDARRARVTGGPGATLADRLLAGVARDVSGAGDVPEGKCAAVGCAADLDPRYAGLAFCLAHQGMLDHGMQRALARARASGARVDAARALAACRRALALREGRPDPGAPSAPTPVAPTAPEEPPPWADPPEVAERIRRTLEAAGLRRDEDGSWRQDFSQIGQRPVGPTAWSRVPEAVRWRIRESRSSWPGGFLAVRDIPDPAVRARVVAREKAGNDHTTGPVIAAELDRAFREHLAEALRRNGDPEGADRVLGAAAPKGAGDDDGPEGATSRGDCGGDPVRQPSREEPGVPSLREGALDDGATVGGDGLAREHDPDDAGGTVRAGTGDADLRRRDGPVLAEHDGGRAQDTVDPLDRAAARLGAAVLRGVRSGLLEVLRARAGVESSRRAEFRAFYEALPGPGCGAEPDWSTLHPEARGGRGERVGWHVEVPREGRRPGKGRKAAA